MNDPARNVWRRGFAPYLSTAQLLALRDGLANDDARLIQGATTSPPPLQTVKDWPCEAACPVAYAMWQSVGILGATVWEVEEAFAAICSDCGLALGEPAACRHFLQWADETPRPMMRRELLAEVELVLAGRLTGG